MVRWAEIQRATSSEQRWRATAHATTFLPSRPPKIKCSYNVIDNPYHSKPDALDSTSTDLMPVLCRACQFPIPPPPLISFTSATLLTPNENNRGFTLKNYGLAKKTPTLCVTAADFLENKQMNTGRVVHRFFFFSTTESSLVSCSRIWSRGAWKITNKFLLVGGLRGPWCREIILCRPQSFCNRRQFARRCCRTDSCPPFQFSPFESVLPQETFLFSMPT